MPLPPSPRIISKTLLCELPILPFLAPRVFQSWRHHLHYDRQSHTAVQKGRHDTLAAEILHSVKSHQPMSSPHILQRARTAHPTSQYKTVTFGEYGSLKDGTAARLSRYCSQDHRVVNYRQNADSRLAFAEKDGNETLDIKAKKDGEWSEESLNCQRGRNHSHSSLISSLPYDSAVNDTTKDDLAVVHSPRALEESEPHRVRRIASSLDSMQTTKQLWRLHLYTGSRQVANRQRLAVRKRSQKGSRPTTRLVRHVSTAGRPMSPNARKEPMQRLLFPQKTDELIDKDPPAVWAKGKDGENTTRKSIRRVQSEGWRTSSDDSWEARKRWLLYRKTRRLANEESPVTRARYVQLNRQENHHLTPFSTSWTVGFAKMMASYPLWLDDALAALVKSSDGADRAVSKRSLKLATQRLLNLESGHLKSDWVSLPPSERRLFWPLIMLTALNDFPDLAMKFLIATLVQPLPPGYAVSDSLEAITDFYLYRESANDHNVTLLLQTVVQIIQHFGHNYTHLTQKTIFLLLSHINGSEAETLYTTLNLNQHRLHENTLLKFTDVLARGRKTDLAVEILKRAKAQGSDFTQWKIQSICATLLQRKYRDQHALLSESEVLGVMLELGLRPNTIVYNILIHNALSVGDMETAWHIHNMMIDIGIKADAYTYSILLNGAKRCRDRAAIDRISNVVRSSGFMSAHIVTDLLHALFLLDEQDYNEKGLKASSPFYNLLPLYCEYFDVGPLSDVAPKSVASLQYFTHVSDTPKMHPPSATLVVMISALLKSFKRPELAIEFYAHFQKLVDSGHPSIAQLAKTTHIYNAIIMALGRHPIALPTCTQIIRGMLDSSPSVSVVDLKSLPRKPLSDGFTSHMEDIAPYEAAAPDGVTEETLNTSCHASHQKSSGIAMNATSLPSTARPIIAKPDVQTWSILLKAFITHGQTHAAEKVLTMMQMHGLRPNQVTWNTLIVGYSRLQDVPNIVRTLERLEDQGWQVDEVTMTGFEWIKDRHSLVRELRAKEQRQKMEQSKDLVTEVEEVVQKAQVDRAGLSLPAKRPSRSSPKYLPLKEQDLLLPVDKIAKPQSPHDHLDQENSASHVDNATVAGESYFDPSPHEDEWLQGLEKEWVDQRLHRSLDLG